ncbi:ATP-binding cassette domain-containing protein [Microbacterium sp. YY-01]|uniref:ATP-binding cassette domain-containing protein n=1 Tax=Microbacterium sp. YY-01 TaxID=3421634 RepID=UPI003D186B6A
MLEDAPPPPIIQCDDLVVDRVGRSGTVRAVDGITFTLQARRIIGISGAAGSGKSSLAAALAGRADSTVRIVGGDALVHGISARHPGRRRRELEALSGYLPQNAGARLDADRTVHDLVAEPIMQRQRRVNMKALQLRVVSLLDELRLSLGTAAKFPYELSSGMRQRVAIARALILDPHLLIADGLLSNLDIDVRPIVIDAIVRRQEGHGMAALILSNDPEQFISLASESFVMHNGHVIGHATEEQVRWTPNTASIPTRAGT